MQTIVEKGMNIGIENFILKYILWIMYAEVEERVTSSIKTSKKKMIPIMEYSDFFLLILPNGWWCFFCVWNKVSVVLLSYH